MISKIKALGLAIVAVAAVAAFTASAAQAAGTDTGAGNGSAILTGKNTTNKIHKLATAEFAVECTQAQLEGTITGQEVKELHVTATYTGCQVFGTTATVDMNGCKFTLVETATTTAKGGVTGCTTGKQIQVTTIACTIDIPEQAEDLSHVSFTNDGQENIHANATVSGVTYQMTGFFCPPPGDQKQGHDAEFTGETTIEAFQDTANQEQVTHNGHQYTRHICGTKLSVQVT